MFDKIVEEAIAAYDKIIGLDLSEVAVDGSIDKAPYKGEGTGPNPLTVAAAGGSGRSAPKQAASLLAGPSRGPTATTRNCSVLPSKQWLAGGFSRRWRPSTSIAATTPPPYGPRWPTTRSPTPSSLPDAGQAGTSSRKRQVPLGLRWPVERTNAWLANFGQLRRNTDRKTAHRLAQSALAITLLIAAKLIDWSNRWSPS